MNGIENLKSLKKRYQKPITDIFASTAFCIYTWFLVNALLVRPGLLLHLSTWDVIGYLAYLLTFALLESIIITICIVGLGFLLPHKFMRMNLSISGSLLVFSLAMIVSTYKFLPKTFGLIARLFPSMDSLLLIQQIVFGVWLFLSLIMVFYTIFFPPNERRIKIITQVIARIRPIVEIYTIVSVASLAIVIGRNII